MTQITTLVGDLGGGKTTLAAVLAQIVKYSRPDMANVANVELAPETKTVDDLHKFIAMKLIKKDKREVYATDDEAAQAGLESRGSGSKGSAIESRIITHSRKAHAYLTLISQLKSMLDKRAQWVEDLTIYCEAVFMEGNNTETPNYFHYTVYDKTLNPYMEFDLDSEEMALFVWPYMDTDDIPFYEGLKQQLINYYDISPDDMNDFEKTMALATAEVPVR